MSLRQLPKIKAKKPASVVAFSPEPEAVERWDAGLVARDGEATISLLDVVGDDFGGNVTTRRVQAALRAIGERDVVVDINSPGGDFFEGIAIYNTLRAHPRKVTVRVLGVAASAASIVAMAGDEILIGAAGHMMIHNAWGVVIGNKHDMRATAEIAEGFDTSMRTVYAARSGQDEAQIEAWMDEEKWFRGEEAIAAGLADGLLPADAVESRETEGAKAMKAERRMETLLAQQGMPRDERRSLIGEVKGGRAVADPDRSAVASDDDWAAQSARALVGIIKT